MTFEPAELLAFLRTAPVWLRDHHVDQLHLPLKVRNALKNARIRYVRDLTGVDPARLRDVRGLGPKAAGQLLEALRLAASLPPPLAARPIGEAAVSTPDPGAKNPETVLSRPSFGAPLATAPVVNDEPLHTQVAHALARLDPLDAEVLRRRLGFNGVAERLDEIGRGLGVTRERARQREDRAIRRLHELAFWPSVLEQRLLTLLGDRREPLFLDLISAEDPWFAGFEDRLMFLGNLIEKFTDQRIKTWTLRGRSVLARIDEGAWHTLLNTALSSLEAHANSGLSKADVKLFLESMASRANAPELGGEVFTALESRLHFATPSPAAADTLVAVGRGLRRALTAILQEAPGPLRLREIQRQVLQRTGVRVNANNCRNALRGVGAYLFGRGTYGLREHFTYDPVECQSIVSQIEQIIQRSSTDRQWHCSQLVRELRRRGIKFPTGFDAYAVNIALSLYSELRNLRRLVWGASATRFGAAKQRRDIADLCIAALREAGRPLSKVELRRAIERVRGLNATFLPQPNHQMAPLSRGVWGLIDRDFGLSRAQRERVLAALVRFLSDHNRPIKASALGAILKKCGVTLPPSVTNDTVVGLAQTDSRLRIGRGRMIGLAEWE